MNYSTKATLKPLHRQKLAQRHDTMFLFVACFLFVFFFPITLIIISYNTFPLLSKHILQSAVVTFKKQNDIRKKQENKKQTKKLSKTKKLHKLNTFFIFSFQSDSPSKHIHVHITTFPTSYIILHHPSSMEFMSCCSGPRGNARVREIYLQFFVCV